ncbi:MAG: GntR family transcriptional regulator [Spirochaetales bacterium]|jgi:DNA-binding GntR family transcriptional regulator|nr:GntR family transcriptional regulator [Spirochaetales bacterium]
MNRADKEQGNLHSRLVAAMKKRILQWEYPPGYRLLEQDVCDEYEVSRSPAREALRTLEADGYLEKMPRKGYLIKQPDPNMAREMYDVRLALELFVIESLAERGSDDPRIAALREQWGAASSCASKNNEEFAELDRKFHETFALVLGNKQLLEQLAAIDERIHVFRTIEFMNEETRKTTCSQHMQILSAVEQGNVAASRRAVMQNIETALQHVEEVIKEALVRSYIRTGGEDTWRR